MNSSLYNYVNNNPINYVDPTGHFALALGWLAGAVASAVGTVLGVINTVAPPLIIVGSLGSIATSTIKKLNTSSVRVESYTPLIKTTTVGANPVQGIPSTNTNKTYRNPITSLPYEPYVEPLLNGIPRSQELDRVSENIRKTQAKAAENAKRAAKEGAGDANTKTDDDTVTSSGSIKAKDTDRVAKGLGFEKTNYKSHGKPVYKKGRRYITPDVDSHNGGAWKMADSVKNFGSKKTRMGTYDIKLKRIGD